MKRAAFLDRDGVLNKDIGYLSRIDQLEWLDGALDAVAQLTLAGLHVFVVTNQSGVARGYYDEAAVVQLHEHMAAVLQRHGGMVDEFVYCPHLPEGSVPEYARACECRKPAPGMILDIMHRHAISREGSFLIGDKPTDMEAAQAAGIGGFLFTGGSLKTRVEQILSSPRQAS